MGRALALDRVLLCGSCSGRGTQVTRQRLPTAAFQTPQIRQTVQDCPACAGTGLAIDPRCVAPALDRLVSVLGALDPLQSTAPRHFDRARLALVHLGESGRLAKRVTAQDRNELAAGRLGVRGEVVVVTGVAGAALAGAGNVRLVPVLVEGRSLVLLRSPVVDAAPAQGEALVGGVLAGASEIWPGRRTIVLDGGFIVPHTEAAVKGPSGRPDGSGGATAPARTKAPKPKSGGSKSKENTSSDGRSGGEVRQGDHAERSAPAPGPCAAALSWMGADRRARARGSASPIGEQQPQVRAIDGAAAVQVGDAAGGIGAGAPCSQEQSEVSAIHHAIQVDVSRQPS